MHWMTRRAIYSRLYAVDERDTRPAFSNFGACTEIFAPGLNILSAWIASSGGGGGGGGGASSSGVVVNNATRLGHGTSMSAPFVAGAAAVFLSLVPMGTADDVRGALLGGAARGKVRQPGEDNQLLPVPATSSTGVWTLVLLSRKAS